MRRAVKAPTVAETIYALLCAEVEAHPALLVRFQTDLTKHDREALASRPGVPFVMIVSVRAEEVQKGDRIYNENAYHPSASWVEVTGVETRDENVVITTSVFTTYLHKRQGIAVER